ncbi:MAG: TorF family putative porin [Burkholderiales bacterium]|nr:TorF family putative porin [Burkholderiales bacterium]
MKRSSVLVSSFLSLGAVSGAFAQATPAPAAPEPAFPLTANVSVTTKYKFRGQDQGGVGTNDSGEITTKSVSPAIQGGFDWSAAGFYVGNWNSNIGFTNTGIEMDFYGGYKGEIAKDFGYDVGILQYYYPQNNKVISFNTTEIYGALTWTFLTLKYSHTVSGDYFGFGKAQQMLAEANGDSLSGSRGKNTGYVELNVNYPIDKWTINAHGGYTHMAKKLRNATIDGGEGGTIDAGVKSYYDYKIGVTYDLSAVMGAGVSAAAAYVGANKKDFYGDINKGRVILTLSKAM